MAASVEQINEWHEHAGRWQASGLSQRAFAIENGLSQRQVSYWARRLGGAQVPPAFVPVPIMSAGTPGMISVHSERGWTMTLPRGVPASWAAEMRRSHRRHFVWPTVDEVSWQISARQWQWLVAGVDWQRLSVPAPAQWRLYRCNCCACKRQLGLVNCSA